MRLQCTIVLKAFVMVCGMLAFLNTAGVCQSSRILSQNSPGNTAAKASIEVKWYTGNLVYSKGVHVYRRSNDSAWTKLTARPILLQKVAPAAVLRQDEDMEAFMDMANNLGRAKDQDFVKLNLFVKSFQSAVFSRLIGIQYDDKDVIWGKTYEYRITRLEGTNEVELGISPAITVGPYQKDVTVADFTATLKKGVVRMLWRNEEARFYGVNVYRNSAADTTWRKMNKTPVVQSETDGAPVSDAMYQDGAVVERNEYHYRIEGLDFFGGATTLSAPVTVMIGDLTPPLSPINLNKSVRILNARISWETRLSDDLVGFHVYRSTKSDGPFERVTQTLLPKTDTVYVDAVPRPAFYYYQVMAVDDAGNEGASFPIMVEVQDVIPPSPPQYVTAKADTGRIVLRWVRNPEPDVMGYYVFRTINQDVKDGYALVNSDPIRDTVYIQKLPKNASNTFLFKVVAVDTSYNRSKPSEIVMAKMPDVTAPITPAIRNLAIHGDSVVITWLANPEKDLAVYRVFREPIEDKKAKERVARGDVQGTGLTFADTLQRGGRYYYRLQAIDQTGNMSALSDPFPVTFTPPFRGTVAGLKGKYNKRKKEVAVRWDAVADEALSGYTVFRKGSTDQVWVPVTGLLQATDYNDRVSGDKATYAYQVRAYSSRGDVVVSADIKVKAGK